MKKMKNQKLIKNGILVSLAMMLFLVVGLGFTIESHSSTGLGTDGEIQGAVLKRLGMDSRIHPHDLGVNVEDGHVKIFGKVNSLEEKNVVSRIVGSIDGVESIRNSLRIKPVLDEDSRIRLVIEQLIEVARLKGDDPLMVTVKNGIVTLKGVVPNREDKDEIQKISENRDGVREVKNLLMVKGIERRDREIHKDVLFYLLWSPFFKKDEIQVEVKDGTVRLNGHVDFLGEKTILAEDLGNIQGVERVDVKSLTIKPWRIPTQSS